MIWLDAQLSPSLVSWISLTMQIPCKALRDLGLRNEIDKVIFFRAKEENVIIITKDKDFVDLVYKYDVPPKVILLTCGNTSNERLQKIFADKLKISLSLLITEKIVEISDI